jgi:alkylation response protein AidB-like acyl-CoA dehydrogenase
VGCDASGQETEYSLSKDGRYYILNGEKKWATSGALCGLFTVTARERPIGAEKAGARDRITAFICTPDMQGIDVFSKNRSKCGIRGTWQARIRFTDVKVPMENLLHEEGKGIKVALSCLDYGRSTLSAGMLGAAAFAREQSIKWAKTRYQFDRPIAEFELIRHKLAAMTAYCYAMDAVLYMTTGMLDRRDEDVMLETAVCKVFSSEMGFRTVDHALQVMGGEGYMTENVVERMWRDNRINIIVEGANEVMHSFIFGYGSKQLGEYLLELKANPLRHPVEAVKIAGELYLGLRLTFPRITGLHPRLNPLGRELERHVQARR